MNANPDLLALAAEKEERRLDKAEAILDRELHSDDPRYSAAAAFFVLRNAKRAAARGWRQPDVEVTVENAAVEKTYVFKWAGDESNLGETMLERDGKSVPVPRYDCGDDCLEGEAAAPAALIGRKPEPEPDPEPEPEPEHEHEPLQTLLPAWPGPGLPPPLVARLYAPCSPPPMLAGPRPAVLRRRLRGVE